jgi:hypothetical protein
MEDAEGGGDFALERIVSMRGRWRDHLMTGLYSGCSIWHSDTYDYWLNVPSLRKTFLGRKIVRSSGLCCGSGTGSCQGWSTHTQQTGNGRLHSEDFLIAALGAPTTVSCVLVLCC